MSDTKVVILAAGKGTRMKASVPKPLVQVSGKPMIVHLLDRIKIANHIDYKPVVVVAPDSLPLFQQTLGDAVDFAVQTEQLGTGHAMKSAKEACGTAKNILVLYGDHPFIEADVIRQLQQLAGANPEALIMLTTKVPNFEGDYAGFVSWSRILRDEAGKLVGDRQVKDASAAELTITELNPCIYVFPADWLWENLEKLNANNAAQEYYLTDLIKIAVDSGKPIVTETVDALQVIGINTPEELARAEKYVATNGQSK
jgi:bifunctional UDP-N-acetylglucosamine pyrophosphorylase/glucosamine-1-phosphate N-acetyltransferase